VKNACWIIAALLAAILAILLWKLVVVGDTAPSSDGRTAIQLTPAERDLVLTEMRGFLASVRDITAASVAEDPAAMSEAARRVGQAAAQGVPVSLMGKLPLPFKKLGLDTHQRFDQLALDVDQMDDPDLGMTQLADLLGNCVACHAAYRIEPEAPTP
jgi:hypothetical protein